ncbi:MAG: hypothetical protein L0271_18030 [Gemmatimonadetes bacterium]|nr:hypothetical protein [Gemmatimonadota bacterium]
MQHGQTELAVAIDAAAVAAQLFGDREFLPNGEHVLHLAADSGCSAYDCEFVAVARDLDVPFVTLDPAVLKAFPGFAVDARRFRG